MFDRSYSVAVRQHTMFNKRYEIKKKIVRVLYLFSTFLYDILERKNAKIFNVDYFIEFGWR